MVKRTRAQRKVYPACTINQLPDELLTEIFLRLPQYAILPATLVCHRWNKIISKSVLLDSLLLRITPGLDEECYLEYEYYLNRTERKYRMAAITIDEQRSFVVAVIALRRFGEYLTELKLTLDQCNHPTYLQMHFERMTELEMGLEEHEQMLWEQEVDSYNRCLRPIARSKEEERLNVPGFEEVVQDFRRIEEVFLAFVYRHCFRLRKLTVNHLKSNWDTRAIIMYYEGAEMESLTEFEVNGTGFIVLADFPKLRQFCVQGITTGLPFYAGFRDAFPMLTQLEVANDLLFDNRCLWVISKYCSNLQDLTLVVYSNTFNQQAFYYVDRLKHLKKLSITLQGPVKASDYPFENWPQLPIEKLFIATHELRVDNIREMILRNPNLVEFVVTTKRRIAYNTLNKLQQTKPTCRLTYRQQIYR